MERNAGKTSKLLYANDLHFTLNPTGAFLYTFTGDFHQNVSRLCAALYKNRELAAEQVHLRLLERLQTCRVSVGYRLE